MNTVLSCQLCAHVLRSSLHMLQLKEFVPIGSLSEQTEHEDAFIYLSVSLLWLYCDFWSCTFCVGSGMQFCLSGKTPENNGFKV